ncbi:MAG: M13 family metallopeptidase [Salinivirgaceae bacterium]|nr:M13 family metallopeptidase [Salinivirgaceae bacterium]
MFTLIKKYRIIIMAGLIMGTQACEQVAETKVKPIDTLNMDVTAHPGTDFNQYANGGWMKNNPIPEDKSRFGSFDQLIDSNEKQLKNLVDELSTQTFADGSVSQKIATFFKIGMDTLQIEEKGANGISNFLESIAAIETKEQIQQQLELYHKHMISSAFGVYGGADSKNSEMVITHLYQSGLGMPDRDYYLNEAERFATIREKYLLHLENNFKLLGDDSTTAKTNAQAVFNFEKRLAVASMDRLDLRDPNKTYHKLNQADLAALVPNFDWNHYFTAIGLENPGDVIVMQPGFLGEFNRMLAEEPLESWKTYFRWNLVRSTAGLLSNNFVDEQFNFYGKVLSGTPELKPRWKRVLDVTNNSLDEAVGQIYVEKYFPVQSKERMIQLVTNLKIALGERINQLTWMSAETKANAQEKLAAINVKIGYPDKWMDYSNLEIKEDSYVANALRARKFSFDDMVSKINKPVDKLEWHMPPQMVNAYYSPTMNEIVFPAGILQPPFFYPEGDDAVNYGAIGVVIGHEMTHGFDDKGRLYDKNGNLNTWWTEEDSKLFTGRADVLVKQFDAFTVLDTIKANGKYTLGENIADLGGINIAYTAFSKTEQWKNPQQKIEGFTPNQRFFLAYAHIWAQNIRDAEILRRTQEDVHSLGKYRVNGPLRNVPEFHDAFRIDSTDYMYLAESERAIIW